MILKPATVSPLTNLELARVFEEAGLPEGVFQVLTGPGGEIGDYLAGHEDVDMVAFTGSVEVGKTHHAGRAAENVKKVGLELGGKSPNIVFADADFEAAIDGALIGIFAGTRRGLLGRLAAARASAPSTTASSASSSSRAMAIKVGDPLDEDERDGTAGQQAAARHGREVRADRPRGGRHAGHRRPPAAAAAASTTSRPSS